MAWDKDQPQNTTKIRNLPAVLTPNWYAIEQADSSFTPYAINLLDRNVLNTSDPSFPVNPAAIPDTYALFSKKDSAGIAQLFGIDTDSTITQFTGVTSTLIENQGSAFLPGGLILKWGTVVTPSGGFGIAVTFTEPYPNSLFKVYITPNSQSAAKNPGYTYEYATTGFAAACGNTSLTTNTSYIWLALGY